MRVYLDHNATTPVAAEVADAMHEAVRGCFGNASSIHAFGQAAKAALDDARSAVAELLGARPNDVIFTGSGTEADNLAIRGVAEASPAAGRRHLVASAIEHEAVLNTLKALSTRTTRSARCSRSRSWPGSRIATAPCSTPTPCSPPARCRST